MSKISLQTLNVSHDTPGNFQNLCRIYRYMIQNNLNKLNSFYLIQIHDQAFLTLPNAQFKNREGLLFQKWFDLAVVQKVNFFVKWLF